MAHCPERPANRPHVYQNHGDHVECRYCKLQIATAPPVQQTPPPLPLPTEQPRGRGRPKGSRGRCSLCQEEGHYRRTCPNATKEEEVPQ